ncbi:MAG: 4-hydroxy-tetrahydrodipicolinate reductase [Woeseiaceae bacterium]|nr:4-hydroxy-tetrahydrodipicolinate reductase [Woeseiaceae bacterium]
MGQAIAESVRRRPGLELVGIWQRGHDIDELVAAADVVIDFSLPEGTLRVIDAVLRRNKPLVCGVSGLDEGQLQVLRAASAQIPLVFDRNMSLGIAVLERLVRVAAASLGPGFEVEVSEIHHIHKKDAPSGTALKLGEAIASSRGEAGTGTVRFQVERRGEVPGDHQVTMSSDSEKLTFAHSVTTREVFVAGALRASDWVVDQAPGCYSMQDVLFGPAELSISPNNW